MIKKLFTIAAVVFTVAANAQSRGTVVVSSSENLNVTFAEKSTLAPGCATVNVINTASNVNMYSCSPSATPAATSCSPNAGYVFGKNCYGYIQHATWFNGTTLGVTNPTITAVSVAFYHNTVTNKGTKGTTGTVGLNVLTGSSNTVMPGTTVTSTVATLSNIMAAQTGTSSLFFYTFTLTPTVVSAGGFYVSLVQPSAAADTAVIYSQTSTASPFGGSANAWEFDNAWSDIATDWGINQNLVMLPILCGSNLTTGISKNLGLSKNIQVMPNPSTGLVNLLVTLAQTENISVTITNAIGQQILSNKYNGISNELISLDLTNQSNGVYFVTVSNGSDKMVQRLILNK